MAVTTSSIVIWVVTLCSTERIVPLKCQLSLNYMALQPRRSDSSRIDVDCYVATCGGLSRQKQTHQSFVQLTYLLLGYLMMIYQLLMVL
jgi:hypothetical protein